MAENKWDICVFFTTNRRYNPILVTGFWAHFCSFNGFFPLARLNHLKVIDKTTPWHSPEASKDVHGRYELPLRAQPGDGDEPRPEKMCSHGVIVQGSFCKLTILGQSNLMQMYGDFVGFPVQ